MASFRPCISIPFSILISILVVGLGSACKSENPYYCPGLPYDNCKFDGSVPVPCDPACSGDKPACDMVRGECVQCTMGQTEACSGTTPVCHGNTCQGCNTQEECGSFACLPDGSCGSCTKHADCTSSLACLPEGMCGDDTNVAYVAPAPAGTDNEMCTRVMPCTLVKKALVTNRPYVKFTGTANEAVAIEGGRQVTFLAEQGAKLTCNGSCGALLGAIVRVRGNGTSLTVYDLSISDADMGNTGILVPNSSGDPIVTLSRVKVMNNEGRGITMNGGTVRISQSEISANKGGGIEIVSGQFDLTNNFIAGNGASNSTFGGVQFYLTNTGTRRFEFNAVSKNSSLMGTAGGVIASGVMCILVQQQVTFSNNIVYANLGGSGRTQVSDTTQMTNCSWTYSDIGPETPTGTGNSYNLNTAPGFVNDMTDLHLTTGVNGSMMRNAADPNATIAVDIDGDPRPRPQGERRDIGADEVP